MARRLSHRVKAPLELSQALKHHRVEALLEIEETRVQAILPFRLKNSDAGRQLCDLGQGLVGLFPNEQKLLLLCGRRGLVVRGVWPADRDGTALVVARHVIQTL